MIGKFEGLKFWYFWGPYQVYCVHVTTAEYYFYQQMSANTEHDKMQSIKQKKNKKNKKNTSFACDAYFHSLDPRLFWLTA